MSRVITVVRTVLYILKEGEQKKWLEEALAKEEADGEVQQEDEATGPP